jgi:hypothetical protein
MAGRYSDAHPGRVLRLRAALGSGRPQLRRGAIWCTTTWPGTALTGPTRRQLPHESGGRERTRAGTNTERWVQIPPVPPSRRASDPRPDGNLRLFCFSALDPVRFRGERQQRVRRWFTQVPLPVHAPAPRFCSVSPNRVTTPRVERTPCAGSRSLFRDVEPARCWGSWQWRVPCP